MADSSLTLRIIGDGSHAASVLSGLMGRASAANKAFGGKNAGAAGKAFGKANSAAKDFNRQGSRLSQVGDRLQGIGQSLTNNVSKPLFGVGAGMIRTAAQFESGMNKVRALTNASDRDFATLRAEAKRLGSITEFSASQAAGAMAFFGASGYDTTRIMNAMPPTLALASATGTDLARTADMVSNSFQAAGVEAPQFAKKAEAMAKVFTSANLGTDLMPLGTQLSRVAGVAKGAGLDINETVAAIGVLGGAGQMNSAGTNLGNIFKAFADSKKSKALEQAGVAVSKGGKFRKFGDILTDIGTATSKMSEVQKAAFLSDTFGVRGARGMQALLDNLENGKNGYKDLVKAAFAAEKGGGLEKLQKTMRSGLSGELTKLGSAWEGLAISVGDTGALSAITSIVQGITGLVQKAANAPPIFTKIGVGIAAMAAIAGPVIMAVGGVVSAIGSIVTAFSAGGALAGIGTAVAAGFAGLGSVAMAAIAPVGGILLSVVATALPILGVLAVTAGIVGAAFVAAGGDVGSFGDYLSIAAMNIVDFRSNAQQVPSAIGSILSLAGSHFTLFRSKVALAFAQIKVAISNTLAGIMTPIMAIGMRIGMAFSQVAMRVITAFSGIGARVGMVFSQIAMRAGMAFSGIVARVMGIVTQIGAAFASIGARVSAAFSAVRSAISSAISAIASQASQIGTAIMGGIQSAIGVVRGAAGMFMSAGAALMRSLASGIMSAVGAAVSAVSGAVGKIRSLLPFSPAREGALSDLDKTGPAFVRTFAMGITPKPLLSAVDSMLAPIPGMLSGSPSAPISQARVQNASSGNGGGSTVHITYSPTYNIGGGSNAQEIKSLLERSSQEFRDFILETLREHEAEQLRVQY